MRRLTEELNAETSRRRSHTCSSMRSHPSLMRMESPVPTEAVTIWERPTRALDVLRQRLDEVRAAATDGSPVSATLILRAIGDAENVLGVVEVVQHRHGPTPFEPDDGEHRYCRCGQELYVCAYAEALSKMEERM